MVGSFHITVSNAAVKYDFTIKRNITIIKGDSATGKTVLIDMIRDYVSNGQDSGVSISCDIPCRVIEGKMWEDQLKPINESIVFIDEGNSFVSSYDFAEYVKSGKNYYVIVTREKLNNLPYSVSEIYGIKSSGKYSNLEPVYHETYHIYEEYTHNFSMGDKVTPDILITEDTNSGYEFFSLATESGKCISAGGKSKVFNAVAKANAKSVLVIADGAAFGSEMERICELKKSNAEIHLLLPESFEWIILNSGVVKNIPGEQIEHPENYADSSRYFSWERYFTDILVQSTKDTYMAYNKSHLGNYYKQTVIVNQIKNSIEGIDFGKEGEK